MASEEEIMASPGPDSTRTYAVGDDTVVASSSAAASLRGRSGGVVDSDRLVQFLYILMRDHVPTGVVEGIVQTHLHDVSLFTNGWLAQYAQDVAERLR